MKIYIEGNIASGKSTLIDYLQTKTSKLLMQVIPEPVEQWKATVDENGKNILSYFYDDLSRWSYLF